MSASPDLRSRILAAAERAATPTRRRFAVRAAVILSAAALLSFFAWYFYTDLQEAIYGGTDTSRVWGGIRLGGAPGHGQPYVTRPLSLYLGTALGAMTTSAIALWLGFGRGRSMLGRPRRWLIALIVLVPIVLFVWEYAWSVSYGPEYVQYWDRAGWKCLGLSLLTGSWPLIAMVVLRRRTDPLHPVLTGTVFGVASGACAWFLVDLWCPVCYFQHLMLGHVLPIALLGAIGAVLGQRVVAIR